MVCMKCGGTVDAGSKFCCHCGAPIEDIAFCPSCGAKLEANQVFCKSCGTKLAASTSEPVAARKATDAVATGKLLRKMHGVTKFLGEPTVSLANKIGTLSIFDDHVEYVRKAGLNLIGTVAALSRPEVESFYYRDCASIKTGSYMAIYTTLVLMLKNGNKVSFCPAVPGTKDMEMVADMLLHYL